MIVLDTNIIFSILLDRGSKIREKFFEKDVRYIAPNFVFVELFKHKEKLLKFSRLSEAELLELLHRILHRITFVDESTIATANRHKALELCQSVDESDTPFVALALELQAELWSGDKKLVSGLRKQGFSKFYEPSSSK